MLILKIVDGDGNSKVENSIKNGKSFYYQKSENDNSQQL